MIANNYGCEVFVIEIPIILKYTFLLHFIACMIFGLVFFLSPEIYVDIVAWLFLDPFAGRVMGSLFLGFGVAAFLGYNASTWEEVRILVFADIVWGFFWGNFNDLEDNRVSNHTRNCLGRSRASSVLLGALLVLLYQH